MACNYLSNIGSTLSADGAVVGNIRSFNVDTSAATSNFTTNTTSGWTANVSGAKSATGTLEYILPTSFTSTPFDVGDCITGKFQVGPNSADYYAGSVRITSEGIPARTSDGLELPFTYNWESDGPLVKNGGLVRSGS